MVTNLSRLYLVFVLLCIPQIRLILGLIVGVEDSSEAMMKLLVAALELSFIALKLVDARPLSLPPGIKRLSIPAALWALWMLLSSALSGHAPVALFRTAEWLTHALFFVVLVSHLWRDSERVREAIHALLLGFVLLAVESAYLHFSYDVELFTAVAGFGNIRHFGHYALVVLILAMTYDRHAELSIGFVFRKSLMLVAWVALFMAGGRGPLLAILVVTLSLLMSGYFSGLRRLLEMFAVGALVGLLFSVFYSSDEWGIYRMMGSIISTESGAVLDAVSTGRIDIWRTALGDVLVNPLFGKGPEGYIYGSGVLFNIILHPHNSALQTMVEWGVPGALFFAVILYRIFVLGFNHAHRTDREINSRILLWLLCVLAFYSLVTGNLYIPFSLFLFVVSLALVSVSGEGRQEDIVIKRVTVLPIFLILSAVLTLQVISFKVFIESGAEPPGMSDKALIQSAPGFATHPLAAARVIEWARESAQRGDEKEALAWLDWGRENMPRAGIYALAKAQLLSEAGRETEALAQLPSEEEIPLIYYSHWASLKARLSP